MVLSTPIIVALVILGILVIAFLIKIGLLGAFLELLGEILSELD